jgi:hypothetical protein
VIADTLIHYFVRPKKARSRGVVLPGNMVF